MREALFRLDTLIADLRLPERTYRPIADALEAANVEMKALTADLDALAGLVADHVQCILPVTYYFEVRCNVAGNKDQCKQCVLDYIAARRQKEVKE